MEQLLGWSATLLFSLAYIPQIRRMLKEGTRGVSPWFLLLPVVANIVALFYALLIHQDPLVVKYILGLFLSALCLVAYFES